MEIGAEVGDSPQTGHPTLLTGISVNREGHALNKEEGKDPHPRLFSDFYTYAWKHVGTFTFTHKHTHEHKCAHTDTWTQIYKIFTQYI